MISMVIPTRNRAHTLQLVAESYFKQPMVTEVIFVNDGGDKGIERILDPISKKFPSLKMKIHHSEKRGGAASARNIGVALAENEYVLFCDDDEYMGADYAQTCFQKLKEKNVGAISGRRIYLLKNEPLPAARARFGNGLRQAPLIFLTICEYVNGAIFLGDRKVPFTNANILTRKDLLRTYPFDEFYSKGNGYREETDYQMNLFVNGYDILITNDCHTYHLHRDDIQSGGARISALMRVYWSFFYTQYFYKKYFERYKKRVGLKLSQSIALIIYAFFSLYKELIRPSLYDLYINFKNSIRK